MYREKGQYQVTFFPDMFLKEFGLEIAYLALPQHSKVWLKKANITFGAHLSESYEESCI